MAKQLVIWIDDMRNPYDRVWNTVATNKKYITEKPIIAWLKNYEEFVHWLNVSIHDKEVLWPTLVCFDHDLGEGKTGFDCAKYLVQFCMDHNMELPHYSCHSSNPAGRENIISYLNSYVKSLQ